MQFFIVIHVIGYFILGEISTPGSQNCVCIATTIEHYHPLSSSKNDTLD